MSGEHAVETSNIARYRTRMTIELSSAVEKQVRQLARKQRKAVRVIVEDAVRQYIEAASITDLDAQEIASTQEALIAELPAPAPWKTRRR